MNGYSPGAGQHAIDQAVVGIRFHRQADDAIFRAAIEKAAELAIAHNLPGRVQLDPLALTFGRQVISHGYNPDTTLSPGLVFQRVEPSGTMAEELTLERGAVTYRTHKYTRWKDVVDLITGIIIPVSEVLSSGNSNLISVIELRCVDRFVGTADSDTRLTSLIRPDSPYIPRELLGVNNMLHSHSGWFENISEVGRTLININVDVSDFPGGERLAMILQVVSRQASGIGNIISSELNVQDAILKTFQSLHAMDKYILSNLLTDDLQKAINLVGDSGTKKP